MGVAAEVVGTEDLVHEPYDLADLRHAVIVHYGLPVPSHRFPRTRRGQLAVGAVVAMAFIAGATETLESLSFVERYAWFALPAEQPGTGLYRDGSTPTAAGLAYREAGRSIS